MVLAQYALVFVAAFGLGLALSLTTIRRRIPPAAGMWSDLLTAQRHLEQEATDSLNATITGREACETLKTIVAGQIGRRDLRWQTQSA